jgi:phage shock protein E
MIAQQTYRGLVLAMTLLTGFALVASGQEHTKDSVETVKKALEAKKAVLMDVREKQEWDRGHLRDATLLPLSSLKDESKVVLPKDKPIYLHCESGVRCLKAAEILRKQGYDARPLKDGYKDLLKEGFPKAD